MHLTKIGLENIKVFGNDQRFDLAPITVLTGPNNSGKSSLTQALLLLKDTFREYPTTDVFEIRSEKGYLHYRYYRGHNFPRKLVFNGESIRSNSSFQSYLSKQGEKNLITIRLPFIFPELIDGSDGIIELNYGLVAESNQIKSVRIFSGNTLVYETKCRFLRKGRELKQSSRINVEFLVGNYIRDNIRLRPENDQLEFEVSSLYEFSSYNGIADKLSFRSSFSDFGKYYYPYLSKKPKDEEKISLQELIRDSEDFGVLNTFENNKKIEPFEKEFPEAFTGENAFLKIENKHDLEDYDGFGPVIRELDKPFSEYLAGQVREFMEKEALDFDENADYTHYMASDWTRMVFALVDRSISFNLEAYTEIFSNCNPWASLDLGFDSLINKNSHRLFSLVSHFNDIQSKAQRKKRGSSGYIVYDFVLACLKQLNMGQEILIKRFEDYGFEIQLDTGTGYIPLKDQGFGIRKLLSLILSIASQAHNNLIGSKITTSHHEPRIRFEPSILILEEPESNLHPRFQSYLADIILLATENLNIQFIVETHSEYLIRRFQYLVSNKEKGLVHTGLSIKYFRSPSLGADTSDQVYELEVRPDGMLKRDFGPGFFDEATRLTLDLLKQQKAT